MQNVAFMTVTHNDRPYAETGNQSGWTSTSSIYGCDLDDTYFDQLKELLPPNF